MAGPLYHNMAFQFSAWGLLMGVHLIVLPKFEAESALSAIDQHRVDWLAFTPTMMGRMLRVIESNPKRYDLDSVRELWHMGAPCAPWLKRAWIDLLGPDRVFELYGGTEGQATTVINGSEWIAHPGSVGRPAIGEIAILDDEGQPVAAGAVGEVYLRPTRSDVTTYRYVGADVRRHGRWETIGDLGWLDEEGFLYLVDRRQDLILSGGANIYPAEVEGAIIEHPAVESCVVVGLRDDDLGQRTHAIVHAIQPVTEQELRDYTLERLVRYKLPRTWEFVDQPLRDEAGKARRSALAADRDGWASE